YFVLLALGAPPSPSRESAAQSGLFRCIFGSPFRYVAPGPAWLAPAVQSLARAPHGQRPLPDGEMEPARPRRLADALEDAGCADPDLLGHLRSPGPHVRGCWAVDLLLGKE